MAGFTDALAEVEEWREQVEIDLLNLQIKLRHVASRMRRSMRRRYTVQRVDPFAHRRVATKGRRR